MDIHRLQTLDNVDLNLAFLPAEGVPRGTWLFTHGVGGAFYRAPLLTVGQELSRRGFNVALLNNRGHDWMWVNRADGRWLGAAYELIEDAALDIQAAVDWLAARGHSRLVLAGHSLGAVKVGYTLAHQRPTEVVAAALCSGPRLPGRPTMAPGELQAGMAKAEELVAAGRPEELIFLTGRAFSARTYLNKYGKGANTAVLSCADRFGVPVMFLAGNSSEGYSDAPMLEHARDLHAALPASGFAEIDGADHMYGGREPTIADALTDWYEALGSAG